MANDSGAAKAARQGNSSAKESEEASGSGSEKATSGVTLVVTAPFYQSAVEFPGETEDDPVVRFDRTGTHVSSKAKADEYIKRAATAGVTLSEKEEG